MRLQFLAIILITASAGGATGSPVRDALHAAARTDAPGLGIAALIGAMTPAQKTDARGRLDALDRRPLDANQSGELARAYRLLGGPPAAPAAAPGAPLARAAAAALDAGRFDEASALATRALEVEPGNREALTVLRFAEGRGEEHTPRPTAPIPDSVAPRIDSRPLKPQFKSRNSAPPPEVFDRLALETLSRSPVGEEIVDFLRKNNISISVRSDLQSDAAAAYYPAKSIIVVPPNFTSEPLIVQAVVLGHEGFHAVQDIEHRSAVSLEAEIDAWERQCVIYKELRQAGVPAAPNEHFVVQAYKLFQTTAARGKLFAFEAWVEANYKQSEKMSKLEMTLALPESLRGAGHHLLNVFPWPAFRSSQRAQEQKGIISRLTGGDEKLRNAIKHHRDNRSWAIEKAR